ncbi:MAG: response regulator [Nitrospirae bacterium]|nr:response regulator [Nitrospirota bacterium]
MLKPRILLADDHPEVLETLRNLLGSDGLGEVVGTVMDGQALVEAAQRLKPDLIFSDISMPGLNGLDATRLLQTCVPLSKVIILTVHREPVYVSQAFEAGARGYLLKRSAVAELPQAIRHVLAGDCYIGLEVSKDWTAAEGDEARPDQPELYRRQALPPRGRLQNQLEQVLRGLSVGGERVLEAGNHSADDWRRLTQEEEASLPLLEPLFARHLDQILDVLARHLVSDPDMAWLLSDDLQVVRMKRAQRDCVRALLNHVRAKALGRGGTPAADSRELLGFDAAWRLRTFAQVLTVFQPLLCDAFRTRPSFYQTVWSALLKVVFSDLDVALRASLTQGCDRVEAARRDMSEMRRAMDLAQEKQVAEKTQRQAEHLMFAAQLTACQAKVSGLAQEMGTPLNVILGQAELLLERTEDASTHAALQSIVRQVERLIPLRQQLCRFDYSPGSEPHASDCMVEAADRPSSC